MYAKIITDIAHQDVDRIYTYGVPEKMEENIVPGMRVIVPFGGRRAVEGYVLELSSTSRVAPDKLKYISGACDEFPTLNPDQLELAKWMAQEYHCMRASILRLFLPAEMRGGRVNKKYKTTVGLSGDEEALQAVLSSGRTGEKQRRVISMLMRGGRLDCAVIEKAVGGAGVTLKSLEKHGVITLQKEEIRRNPYESLTPAPEQWHALKPMQEKALEHIINNISEGRDVLLHGITGSGKTEVYMRAIKHVLEQGGGAIMLIPEISLTPQTVERFRQRFGESVAVLHSALSAGERYDEWRRIRLSEARVVVGARSAVFAPCENLKLIIIDEAHESSYNAEGHPAYRGVEVARKRMRLTGGALVLGSATPSVEQYYQARNGEYDIIELNERINGRPLPQIEVADMAAELAAGNKSIFSRLLYEALKQTIDEGNQAILFLNRRGHSTIVNCRSCGKTVQCAHCEVSMTYHLSDVNSRTGKNRLRCHYCGYEMPYPAVCPYCGSKFIKHMGAGTEKVEEQFNKLFPGVATLRMDNDTTRTRNAHLEILSAFSRREAQVLIGTQMIAKGLDFPAVALVGIVSADTMLQLPDYRSRERTFSLVTQVAGRAGRAEAAGRVILQTYTPRHYAIVNAVNYDYENFYKTEIIQRKQGLYPPFAALVRLLFVSEDFDAAKRACMFSYQELTKSLKEKELWKNVVFLTMMSAPIGRIKGQYRQQVLIKLRSGPGCFQAEQCIFEHYDQIETDNFYKDIEVNPSNLF